MDTITHFVAGALSPAAFKDAPRTKTLTLFGILCGELPDIDVIVGKSPEAILAVHRGITHALIAQPALALVMALIFHKALKKSDEAGTWTFAKTWSVALFALLTHLFLDCATTFGTQIFLPFSDFRVALPAIYIIDPLLTLPLAAALIFLPRQGENRTNEAKRVPLARKALAWLFCYPLLALGANHAASAYLETRHAARGNERGITRIELSPEPFSPLNWKIVGIAPETYYVGQFLLPLPHRDVRFAAYKRPNAALWEAFRSAGPVFSLYADFAAYPFLTEHASEEGRVITVADVRYESTLPDLMKRLGRSDGLFLLQTRLAENGEPSAWRFLYRGREAAETPWTPFAETPPAKFRYEG